MTPCSNPRLNVFVIHGLGGIGKTQLAVEYARRNHNRYSALFWLDQRGDATCGAVLDPDVDAAGAGGAHG